jgi:hypothetical protein
MGPEETFKIQTIPDIFYILSLKREFPGVFFIIDMLA